MERRFDMSDFEQSLKEYADQFKIMPSKRVWNGIYNHLHPGSKWPSITVAIVFVITLISIGNLNNSSYRVKKTPAISSNFTILSSNKATGKVKNKVNPDRKNNEPVPFAEKSSAINIPFNSLSNSSVKNKNTSAKISSSTNIETKKTKEQNKSVASLSLNKNNIAVYDNFSTKKIAAEDNSAVNKQSTVNKQITGVFNSVGSDALMLQPMETAFSVDNLPLKGNIEITNGENLFFIANRDPVTTHLTNTTGKTTVEDKVALKRQQKNVTAKKFSRKKKNNIEWLYYIEPTISYVSFHSKDIHSSSLLSPSSLVVLTNQSPFQLVRNPRPGFEAGMQAGFHISKKFQIISGLNLSYSAYSNVSNLVHPTFASLILTDNSGNLYERNFITHYGNGESQSLFPLVNYRLETGIPVGLQYKLWKNDKMEIELNSVLEPSFVLKSNAYIISSDGRYYVTDPALIRKVNLDGKFGSYLSFYAKKIKWHIGPDIRYQFFSSYKDIYPTQEHFIDYGIRIGISR